MIIVEDEAFVGEEIAASMKASFFVRERCHGSCAWRSSDRWARPVYDLRARTDLSQNSRFAFDHLCGRCRRSGIAAGVG